MTRNLAVVTTFSKAGFHQYGQRMIDTWLEQWPGLVTLVVYPDEPVPIPVRHNVKVILDPIPEKVKFIKKWSNDPRYTGGTGAPYNYRFDAIKFCHKPFALWDFARRSANMSRPYDGIIWLDADTVTHAPISPKALGLIAPDKFDVQFLGRSYKYTECGYLWFNLRRDPGMALLQRWVDLYTTGRFKAQKEWHDSWLFDVARGQQRDCVANDLTGHIPRRQGGGHPLVNSFLGAYLDHLKGDARKVTGKPRPNDLFVTHDTDYWRKNSHAKHTPRPKS